MSKRMRRTLRIMKADELVAMRVYEAVDIVVQTKTLLGGHRQAHIAHCLNLVATCRRQRNYSRARQHLRYLQSYKL